MGGRGGKIRGVGRGAEREREREEHPAARPLHSTHRSPLQPALTRRPCSRIELELAIDSQVFCGADNARFNRLPLRLRDWASTRSRRPSPTSFTRLSLSLPPPPLVGRILSRFAPLRSRSNLTFYVFQQFATSSLGRKRGIDID